MGQNMHTITSTFLTLVLTAFLSLNLYAQDKAPKLNVETLLDQIQAKSDSIKTYKAAVRFDQIQGLLGDEQTRFGALYYVTKPKIKFAVDFQRVVIDKKLKEQNRQWI